MSSVHADAGFWLGKGEDSQDFYKHCIMSLLSFPMGPGIQSPKPPPRADVWQKISRKMKMASNHWNRWFSSLNIETNIKDSKSRRVSLLLLDHLVSMRKQSECFLIFLYNYNYLDQTYREAFPARGDDKTLQHDNRVSFEWVYCWE